MRWCSKAKEGTIIIIGGNEEGEESNQFTRPKRFVI
jgi:hypothetical protein